MSLRYIQDQLDRIGYRTTLLMHPAYISLPGPARVEVDGAVLTAITHSFSRPSPPDGLSRTPLYLGQGADADFDRDDLAGAIVLVEGIANPAVAARGQSGCSRPTAHQPA